MKQTCHTFWKWRSLLDCLASNESKALRETLPSSHLVTINSIQNLAHVISVSSTKCARLMKSIKWSNPTLSSWQVEWELSFPGSQCKLFPHHLHWRVVWQFKIIHTGHHRRQEIVGVFWGFKTLSYNSQRWIQTAET